MSLMATNLTLFFVLFLLLLLSPLATSSPTPITIEDDTKSACDALADFNFPQGLLPKGAFGIARDMNPYINSKTQEKRSKMEKIGHTTVATNGINMHIASIGTGPVILFLHGFPELWYSWRHQLLSLSSLGYRCIAPDLRGHGDTDAPPSSATYSGIHIAGDLVGLLDHLGIDQVFLVGHDWGAMMAWYFCWFRPDRVKALVTLSVPFFPRNPTIKFVDGLRASLGDDYYFCWFQEPGVAEEDFARMDTAILMKKFFSVGNDLLFIPKDKGFSGLQISDTLPSWLTEEDINYYAKKFDQKGFTGGLNYYRAADLTWELTAPWTGLQVKVPSKFIVGDQDIVYKMPGVKEYVQNGGFKKDVPNLQDVVVMEGVAHFINQEKPEEISTHIYDFIKKF